ncbi:polyubiquitin [Gigaspora margarita]|uniref:Polyubiquitin n=1 Tax=Gigaspora margarita TaxID=4874 RepID=A0A8H3X484_GIGMA|nr:polyubiquitin [Gigaspora margarita]
MILFVILGSGEKITLMVFRQNTVESVKKKIWNRIGISVNKQRLEYLTKELSNEKTLEYYDIRNEGVVYLSLYMSLFVVIKAGKTIHICASKDDTIESVKQKIHHCEGIPANEQRLVCVSKELENGKKLSDYNIRDENTMYLRLRVMGGY